MTSHSPQQFWLRHFYIPLIIFIAVTLTIEFAGVDLLVADYFYQLEGGRWALRNAWLTEKVIHIGGRNVSILAGLVLLAMLVLSYSIRRLQPWRDKLTYLFAAVSGGLIIVALIKAFSHASCAWDFTRYGGAHEYATVFSELIHGSGNDCFPAGHASAGYAWIALYFLGLYLQSPRVRWIGLTTALTVGLVFGFSQQLRGAHFISHDVWTLGLCWFSSLLLYRIMLFNKHPVTTTTAR